MLHSSPTEQKAHSCLSIQYTRGIFAVLHMNFLHLLQELQPRHVFCVFLAILDKHILQLFFLLLLDQGTSPDMKKCHATAMWGDLFFGQEFHNFFTSIFWLLLAADELVLELPDLQTHCQSLN